MSFPLPSKGKIHPPLQVPDSLLVTTSARWNPLSVDHRSSLSSAVCAVGLFGVSRADWWPPIPAAHSVSVPVSSSDNPLCDVPSADRQNRGGACAHIGIFLAQDVSGTVNTHRSNGCRHT
ncbi:hypothetical protein T07_4085 [Trichinella nelsoni]|uniref:Uncharacterized protein n=1 Tax=Trichinella nelsoni TaxID=6336 RepID=A0A0V0RQ89_9BILA|nr:hypothetical protein T07_4085 [Trichinella nelsoni]